MNSNDYKILLGVMKWIQTIEILLGVMKVRKRNRHRNFLREHIIHLYCLLWQSTVYDCVNNKYLVRIQVASFHFDFLILRTTIQNWWFRSHKCLRRPIAMTCMFLCSALAWTQSSSSTSSLSSAIHLSEFMETFLKAIIDCYMLIRLYYIIYLWWCSQWEASEFVRTHWKK